ncbi:MAG: hypothetical protein GY801_05040 [bacterium]|nr:hypothetical protein [bacterium]
MNSSIGFQKFSCTRLEKERRVKRIFFTLSSSSTDKAIAGKEYSRLRGIFGHLRGAEIPRKMEYSLTEIA